MRSRHFLYVLLAVISFGETFANGDNWSDILKRKKGSIEFYWYPNNVIVENSLDIIDGIEQDLAKSFVSYLESMYNIELELKWIETSSFDEVMRVVREGKGGTFGASSFSITPQRKQYFNFTEPYMVDIAVLVSNDRMPVAMSEFQLSQILKDKVAVSIKNTTLIDALLQLRENLDVNFEIEFTDTSGDILNQVSKNETAFGYVDIANFLVAVDKNSGIRRQLFYPVKLEGLAMIYPKESDWADPVNDYFNSARFQEDRQRIITKYLGPDATEIINRISKSVEIGPLEEIILSSREKEAQYEKLLDAARRDKESQNLNIILISIIIVVIVVLILVYLLYRIKSQNTVRLLQQQKLVEETNNKLRGLNEDKNNLIQVLAHDLRSPLGNIYNGAQIIESQEKLSDGGKKILSFILQSSEKMQSLINKILDVDAIETGRHNIKKELFDITEVVEQVVRENEDKASQKSISIQADVANGLMAEADKVYTSQVIENLISNAIKYSSTNSKVEVTGVEEGDMVVISVKDEGPGLTESDQKKLFRKFQQLSAKPTKGESSIGLGLSIVKLFTERMGGEVSYDTEVGTGTTFHIKLKKGN